MRFIVKEQSYEKVIASGQFRYEKDGQPTGALETWRLSTAVETYELLRVDLDAREAASGHSYLYHLVRQVNGRPERLSYRFWGDGLNVEGTLLFSETNVTGTRQVNGRTYEEDLDTTPETGFWFPSAIGLGLAVQVGSGTAVTLNNAVGAEQTLALQPIEQTVTQLDTAVTEITIAGKAVKVSSWQVNWHNHTRMVTTDENGWPLHMKRDDGLTAVETRNIWY